MPALDGLQERDQHETETVSKRIRHPRDRQELPVISSFEGGIKTLSLATCLSPHVPSMANMATLGEQPRLSLGANSGRPGCLAERLHIEHGG